MRIQGGIPVGGNLGFYPQVGFKTLDYMPDRDYSPAQALEYRPDRDYSPIRTMEYIRDRDYSPARTLNSGLLGAMFPAGNAGGLIAQAMPGAAALGGQMRMVSQEQQPEMMGPNVFSVRPRVSYLEPEEGGLELGGAINVPIGAKGRINVQGGYQPETSMMNVQGSIGQPQGAPGLGLDFFVRRNLNRRNNPMGMMGMPMDDMGGQLKYETQF